MFCSNCSRTIVFAAYHITKGSISYLPSHHLLLEGPSQSCFGIWSQTSNRNPSMLETYPFSVYLQIIRMLFKSSQSLKYLWHHFPPNPVPGRLHVTQLVRGCARAGQFVVCCRRRSWWLGHRRGVEGDAIDQTVHKECGIWAKAARIF